MLLGMEDPGAIMEVRAIACVDAPRVSRVSARGWRAYRVDDLKPASASTSQWPAR